MAIVQTGGQLVVVIHVQAAVRIRWGVLSFGLNLQLLLLLLLLRMVLLLRVLLLLLMRQVITAVAVAAVQMMNVMRMAVVGMRNQHFVGCICDKKKKSGREIKLNNFELNSSVWGNKKFCV